MRNDRMQEGSTAVALAMVTPGYDQQDPASGVADYASHQDQAQFEADKRAVYKHPLFPLLALLFERCEQATQSSDYSSSENFNMDIQAFVQHQEQDRKPFLINDPEIDGLMIKAIQVLRIHLLELEKVQELCKDFCNRYITCLKGKMQSENLLRSDYSHHGSHDGMAPSSGSNGSSPLQVLSSTGNDVESGANGFRVSSRDGGAESVPSENGSAGGGGGAHYLRGDDNSSHYNNRPASTRSSSSDAHSTPRRRYQSDIHQDYDDQRSTSPVTVHGGTPLSQIGAHHDVPVQQSANDMYLGQGSPSSMQSDEDSDACNLSSSAGVGSHMHDSKKQKRGVLPKQATTIMRAWLFQHMIHPYPTEDEKREIANQTNLTLLQVNNWFINARRRILQPMMEQGGPPLDPSMAPIPGSHHHLQQQQQQSGNSKKSKSKARSSSVSSGSNNGGNKRGQQREQRQGDWQSDDSGSESNDLSDAQGGYGYDGSKTDQRTQPDGEQDDDNSEDGSIDIEDSKPLAH